jgi:Ni,Fe-hydrogenase I cytochrome b subunit
LDLTEGYVYYAGNTSMIVTAITAGFVMYKTRYGSGVFRFRFFDLTTPHRFDLHL